eukprot:CAMPEP_0168193236 /NCGR_PEP_ID=MMETSP0139_2-20121125/18493_1 /TAXON_ID=44445 /ORGANISM="Pseudo-nitzschia australis, Strain 10249 10 AB" /LENGTH=594 /DNA_ID=CAMNT_0008116567 /DNA_START=81 /DNA_END=1863 /DNA_ORIENTATION=-
MAQRRQKQTLPSASWKKIELESRSTSFPAVVHGRNQLLKLATRKEGHDDYSHATEDGSVKSWVKALHSLAQSTISMPSPAKNNEGGLGSKMIDLESSPRSPQRTPVLIITLIKLHDIFETFCRHLTDATYINVQKACLVLDSTVVTVSPNNSKPSSPAPIIDSPSSQRSSSPRSPITSWLMGSYAKLFSKDEWEKFCNPLIIFAGLEAIYSACAHIESHVQAQTLVILYEKSIEDLRFIREVLCDPFINSAGDELSTRPSMISSYQEKARTLADSIEAIMSLCECRCKLIEQQRRICSFEIIEMEKMIASFQMMLRNLPRQTTKSTPLVNSVVRELELWCIIAKTYVSFGKLGFLNSIICCQKIKLKLDPSSTTCIQKWMCKIFQSFVSILPIYFDCVSSDVIARYGFLESSFREKPGENRFGPHLDLETKLEEFLRLQERNGTSLVVAVVVDVSCLNVLRSNSESCSSFNGKEKSLNMNQFLYETGDILSSFPAVYLASTMQDTLSSKILTNHRSSVRKDIDSDHAIENDPKMGLNSRIEMDSWPYSSWDNLVPLFRSTTSPLNAEDDSVEIHWSQIDSDTLVYVSSIHEAMW